LMGEPLSPDRVFDFPMDELEPHPAYNFFAPGPLPGRAGIAEPIEGIEEQVIALVIDMEEDIAMLFGDGEFSDDDSDEFEDEEELCPHRARGPSNVAAEGKSFTLPTPGFPVPPSVIEDLSTRMGNLEYGHGQLVKKRDGCRLLRPQMVQAVGRLEQVGIQVDQGQQTASHESTLMQCILGMDRRLADLERRPPGP
ncbi:hypothetical protein Tco_1099959, partial [Tanacetum coccineum]